MRKLWLIFIVIFAFSFAVLGWIGTEIFHQAPPIPREVVTTDGRVLIAAEEISDGQIRIGFFVYSTAQGGSNDFTVSGVLDATYNGTVNFDNDGDFKPNGTLTMQRVECSTITLP